MISVPFAFSPSGIPLAPMSWVVPSNAVCALRVNCPVSSPAFTPHSWLVKFPVSRLVLSVALKKTQFKVVAL